MLANVYQPIAWDYTPSIVRQFFVKEFINYDCPLVDIGAGSGSIALDWVSTNPNRRAIAIENNWRIMPALSLNVFLNHGRVQVILDSFNNHQLPAVPYVAWIGCLTSLDQSLLETLTNDPNLIGFGVSHHHDYTPSAFEYLAVSRNIEPRILGDNHEKRNVLIWHKNTVELENAC